jgi:threonine dehydrogenase-like Zn-dependent dehydrogenase
MEHLGFNREGTFAEYFCVRSDRARRVPESLDLAVAALLEPVSVCLHALKRARLEENETLLVVGDGPFGILMGRLASRRKPRQIIIVGRHPFRLQQLKGAFPIHRRAADETEAAVKAAAGGEGVDVAVLAVGAQSALDLCMSSLRAQGRLVVFSAIPDRCSLDLFRLHTQEIEMLGACNDQNLIDDALVELAEPENHLAALVTHRLPFVQWPHAFELARERKDQALKVALIFGGTS